MSEGGPPSSPPSSALLTDHYELTMLEALLRSGTADRRAVFEVFARHLPPGRRYGVVAGTGRLLEELAAFRFEADQLAWLRHSGVVSPATLEWLARYRFSGTIRGYHEGELFVGGSPVLTVEGPLAEALVLETMVLSVLNHDSAVAAAGARMVVAAGGRPLVEAGGRRTHERAAPAAARAAYLVGFAGTSNLEAGRRWGVPTGGTAAHALVMAHRDELDAFRAQVASAGVATTLLVDTYDLVTGLDRAVAAAGPDLGAVRIDSGDLDAAARIARGRLDALGATSTRIVVSGDLDEWRIAALRHAPVDRMLVGTALVGGSGAPTAGFVYKLVAVADGPGDHAPLRPVAKTSPDKATRGGCKVAHRRYDEAGRPVAEVLTPVPDLRRPAAAAPADPGLRPLQVPLVEVGTVLPTAPDLSAARAHHARCRAELPAAALSLEPGGPAFAVDHDAGPPR